MDKITQPCSYEYFELGVRREAFNFCKNADNPNQCANYFIDKYLDCLKDYYEQIPNNFDKATFITFIKSKLMKYICKDCAWILVFMME